MLNKHNSSFDEVHEYLKAEIFTCRQPNHVPNGGCFTMCFVINVFEKNGETLETDGLYIENGNWWLSSVIDLISNSVL